MKVLHVLHHSLSILADGYAVRSQSILGTLRQHGIEACAVTAPADRDGIPEHEEGIPHWRTPALKTQGEVRRSFNRYQQLVKMLRIVVDREHPDLIHAHSPVYNGYAALRVAREKHIPCMYEMRAVWEDAAVDRRKFAAKSIFYRVARLAETRLFNSVDGIFTICAGLQSEVLKKGVPAEKITVVPNAIPRAAVRALGPNYQLKHQLGWPDGPVFGFIGSLFHYEGVDRILDVIPAVLSKAPNVRFLILGGGECEQEIRQRTATWKKNEVVFRPRVSHSEVASYYSVTDCLVYPRRSVRLTELVTPLKPLEAMAMKRAVIASNIGGHRELIQDHRTGLLFDNRDPHALQNSILRLAQDESLLRSLAASGQEFVSNERTWDCVGARYLPVYERLVASH